MKLQNIGIALLICGLGASTALAQPVRTDALYVPFMTAAESVSIDGDLSDAAWAGAEVLTLNFGENAGLPNSGWFTQNDPNGLGAPGDPPSGTIRMLAKGDSLYVGIEVDDASVGGSTGLWNFDGIFMPLGDWTEYGPSGDGFHHFNSAWDEFMYVWWNEVDTTATGAPMPGIAPRKHSHDERYGVGAQFSVVDSMYTEEQNTNWEAVTVVNGTASDDTGDPDTGYTIEMRINLAPLGFDIDGTGGDIVPMGLAIQDADWYWGGPGGEVYTSRVWFQGQWGNFGGNAARLVFDPSHLTDSGEPALLEPDIIIPNGADFAAATVDGVLDDEVWMHSSPGMQIQYGNEDLLLTYPNVTRMFSGYFKPDAAASGTVVDANLNNVYWHFRDDMLYVGVDVDDQAVDTTSSNVENGDGFRLVINDNSEVDGDNKLLRRDFLVAVGPDAEPYLAGYFLEMDESAYDVGVSLKGASTAADPTDVDEGYQFEIAIDLTALNFPTGLGDGTIYLSTGAYDSDRFEDPANNYRTLTWWSRERSNSGLAFAPVGFMDPNTPVNVATETTTELPEGIRLDGNYPNPFNPSTTLRFAIPETGEVTVRVYDLLGRSIRTLVLGQQSAGMQQVQFTASDLASGTYFYRVELRTAAGNVVQSAAERMVLLK